MRTTKRRMRPRRWVAVALTALMATAGIALAQPAAAADDVPSSNVAPLAEPTASYTAGWNSIGAVIDGKPPVNSGGGHGDVWGTYGYGENPSSQWLELTWAYPATVDSSKIWFWHDAPAGTGDNVATPESWTLEYWDEIAAKYLPVANSSGFPTVDDGVSETTFNAVTTSKLRATFIASPGLTDPVTYAGVAATEWEVWGTGGAEPEVPVDPNGPIEIREVHVPTAIGVVPELPKEIIVVYENGRVDDAAVVWERIESAQVAEAGTFEVSGQPAGVEVPISAHVWVRAGEAGPVVWVDYVSVITLAGVAPILPDTVVVEYEDGSKDSRIAVEWDDVFPDDYAEGDTLFSVYGAVEGTDRLAEATVFVDLADDGEDTISPTITIRADPGPAVSGWHTEATLVTVEARDNRDPAPSVEVSVDDGEWLDYAVPIVIDADGIHTVDARATDTAGNVAESTMTAKLDATGPVTTATVANLGTSVEIALNAVDELSGVDRIQWEGPGTFWGTYQAPFTRSLTDEPQVIEFAATDAAGNQEARQSLELPAIIDADVTAPDLTLVAAEDVPASGWYIADVTVVAEAVDDTDPEPTVELSIDDGAWSPYSAPVTVLGDGEHLAKARATDAAGNVSAEQSLALKLDGTAPVPTVQLDEDLRAVTVAAEDGTSGVDRIEYRLNGASDWTKYGDPVLIGAEAGTIEYRAVDVAGNTSENLTASFEAADATPPGETPPPGGTTPPGSTPPDGIASTGTDAGLPLVLAALLLLAGLALGRVRRRQRQRV